MAVAALYSDSLETRPQDPRVREESAAPSRPETGNSGRVRSSKVGFRIGPLGLSYTHRRLDLDSEELERLARAFDGLFGRAKANTAAATFLTEGDLDTLAAQADASGSSGKGADPSRRRGLKAYAAQASGRNEGRPRALLSVV